MYQRNNVPNQKSIFGTLVNCYIGTLRW